MWIIFSTSCTTTLFCPMPQNKNNSTTTTKVFSTMLLNLRKVLIFFKTRTYFIQQFVLFDSMSGTASLPLKNCKRVFHKLGYRQLCDFFSRKKPDVNETTFCVVLRLRCTKFTPASVNTPANPWIKDKGKREHFFRLPSLCSYSTWAIFYGLSTDTLQYFYASRKRLQFLHCDISVCFIELIT